VLIGDDHRPPAVTESFVETRVPRMWREQIPIFRGSSIPRTEFSGVAEMLKQRLPSTLLSILHHSRRRSGLLFALMRVFR